MNTATDIPAVDAAAVTLRSSAPSPDEMPERVQLAEQLETALVEHLLPVLAEGTANGLGEPLLRTRLHAAADQHCHPPAGMFSDAERRELVERAVADVLSYGPLQALWQDESVGEIVLNGPGEAYVQRQGRLHWIDPPLADEAGLRRLVERLCARAGTTPNEAPIFEARLPDGARLSVVRWPLSVQGTLVSLRRNTWRSLSAQELLQAGCAAPEMLEFLAACVQARLNILVAGPPGSGATALLGTLARSIPREERIVTVEEIAELRLQQPHWTALEARIAGPQQKASVRELLEAALRMHPDRLLLGECRGPETAALVQAMAGGRDGVLTAIAAHTPRDALNRLETLVLRTEPQAPPKQVRQDIAAGVQIIVQLAWQRGGPRRVASITEVAACEGDTIVAHELFRYHAPAVRGVSGQFLCCGNRPQCMPQLAEAGANLPAGFFDRRPLEGRPLRK